MARKQEQYIQTQEKSFAKDSGHDRTFGITKQMMYKSVLELCAIQKKKENKNNRNANNIDKLRQRSRTKDMSPDSLSNRNMNKNMLLDRLLQRNMPKDTLLDSLRQRNLPKDMLPDRLR